MAADVEDVLKLWAWRQLGLKACTELPPALETLLPVVQFTRLGGPDGRFTESPGVDVDVYAATYDEAKAIARQVRDGLRQLRGAQPSGAQVQSVRVDSGPSRRPTENPALRRVGATYTVYLH
jgi:hypothetical protein